VRPVKFDGGVRVAADNGDDVESVEPRADALVESLRAFGYSPETAVADLVDNSISASAGNIKVHFHWDGPNSWVAIIDDGAGMSLDVLRNAMRLGSHDPRTVRRAGDLGRFGLGLKTASFSQCRNLTVSSTTNGPGAATRRWDLDHVRATARWEVFAAGDPVATKLDERHLSGSSGTVVLWQQLDRLLGRADTSRLVQENHFYRVADRVGEHLRLTFHRLMRGPGRVQLSVNGRALQPWDPFGEELPATQVIGDEHLTYRGHRLRVRSFVLPHSSRLGQDEHDALAGPRGWNSQQGFYVYRNRRLIIAGDWLGLGFRRDEVTRLARIQLDLPNTLDEDWQLDVRKSVARPPAALADQLRRIAEATRTASVNVFRHRGRVLERQAPGGLSFAWQQMVDKDRVSYRINREHPLVRNLAERGADAGQVETLLRVLEETVPVPLILLEQADGRNRQTAPFEGAAPDAVRDVAADFVRTLRRTGLSDPDIRIRLQRTEPFANFPDLPDILMGDPA
jgi:Histidine kinase-, DNA gyrase B-, and HSP90-like ATPase